MFNSIRYFWASELISRLCFNILKVLFSAQRLSETESKGRSFVRFSYCLLFNLNNTFNFTEIGFVNGFFGACYEKISQKDSIQSNVLGKKFEFIYVLDMICFFNDLPLSIFTATVVTPGIPAISHALPLTTRPNSPSPRVSSSDKRLRGNSRRSSS